MTRNGNAALAATPTLAVFCATAVVSGGPLAWHRAMEAAMLDGRRRTISLCMNIDGFVRNNRYPRDYNIFQRDDGTPLTPAEARTFLALEKAKGHHVIPMSAECGNPCKHANNGCTGFDYGERGGCPGRFTDGVSASPPCKDCDLPNGCPEYCLCQAEGNAGVSVDRHQTFCTDESKPKDQIE